MLFITADGFKRRRYEALHLRAEFGYFFARAHLGDGLLSYVFLEPAHETRKRDAVFDVRAAHVFKLHVVLHGFHSDRGVLRVDDNGLCAHELVKRTVHHLCGKKYTYAFSVVFYKAVYFLVRKKRYPIGRKLRFRGIVKLRGVDEKVCCVLLHHGIRKDQGLVKDIVAADVEQPSDVIERCEQMRIRSFLSDDLAKLL